MSSHNGLHSPREIEHFMKLQGSTISAGFNLLNEETVISESIQQLKETNHHLKLNDAVERNRIRKIERDVEETKEEQNRADKNMVKLLKQHNTDLSYLSKQKELESRYQIELELTKLTNIDFRKEIATKLKGENQNLTQLQSQMIVSQDDCTECLNTLSSIEKILKQSQEDPDHIHSAIIDAIDVYERSIQRKNSEMDNIKNCLIKEKQKLFSEKEQVDSQIQLMKSRRLQQQKSLYDLEKTHNLNINQRESLIEIINSNPLERCTEDSTQLSQTLPIIEEIQTVSIDLFANCFPKNGPQAQLKQNSQSKQNMQQKNHAKIEPRGKSRAGKENSKR